MDWNTNAPLGGEGPLTGPIYRANLAVGGTWLGV